MLKKSVKYLIVVIGNLVILTVLLVLWTDKLELTFNEVIREIEVLKLVGFGVLSLIGIGIVVDFCRRVKITSQRLKVTIAMIVTLLISSYLYVDYLGKVVDHAIVNGEIRKRAAGKIEPFRFMAYGTMAQNLSIEEYIQIRKICGFPTLPPEASDIQYKYGYDGFLPDYFLELTYYLPVEVKVDTIDYVNGDFSRYQSFEILRDKKRVRYGEYEK